MSAQSAASLLQIPQPSGEMHSYFTHRQSSVPDFEALMHQRRRRVVRPQKQIVAAILDACRTPTVQHWVMVKARLGYDTFWKHMNHLVSLGMMNTTNDGCKTLYSVNEKGLKLLRQLEVQ